MGVAYVYLVVIWPYTYETVVTSRCVCDLMRRPGVCCFLFKNLIVCMLKMSLKIIEYPPNGITSCNGIPHS